MSPIKVPWYVLGVKIMHIGSPSDSWDPCSKVKPLGPPLSKFITDFLWTGISTLTPDGFLSWRYWYCLQKPDIQSIIKFLKISLFFKNSSQKRTEKICFMIWQGRKPWEESNHGIPGDRQASNPQTMDSLLNDEQKIVNSLVKEGVLRIPFPECQAYKTYVWSNRVKFNFILLTTIIWWQVYPDLTYQDNSRQYVLHTWHFLDSTLLYICA